MRTPLERLNLSYKGVLLFYKVFIPKGVENANKAGNTRRISRIRS